MIHQNWLVIHQLSLCQTSLVEASDCQARNHLGRLKVQGELTTPTDGRHGETFRTGNWGENPMVPWMFLMFLLAKWFLGKIPWKIDWKCLFFDVSNGSLKDQNISRHQLRHFQWFPYGSTPDFSTLPMLQEGSALCHANWLAVTRTSPRWNWFRNIHCEDPDWTVSLLVMWIGILPKSTDLSVYLSIYPPWFHRSIYKPIHLGSDDQPRPTLRFLDRRFGVPWMLLRHVPTSTWTKNMEQAWVKFGLCWLSYHWPLVFL